MRDSQPRKRQSLYLAGPLFSEAELTYNKLIKERLEEFFDVFLPQEDGALMPDLLKNTTASQAARIVFNNDIKAVERSDVLLIILDGRSIDEGASFELGVAYAMGKHCVALQTDFRRLAPFGNNPMITGALASVFGTPDELVRWAKRYGVEQYSMRVDKSPGEATEDATRPPGK